MVRVAVMGCGTVGSGVIEMLTRNGEIISRACGGADVRLKYALDIREVAVPDGARFTTSFEDILNDPEVGIVVETIGGAGIAKAYTERLLAAGKSVVTSNKELVAAHGDALLALAAAHGCRYLCEASVGGGVPILRPIRSCLAGNRLTKIEGIVNGSTNYLLTRMERAGLSFPAAIAEAQDLGYVEQNPEADVMGWDAQRKLSILANAAFGSRLSDYDKIPTEGIARITERDLACARAVGGAIKLIAHAALSRDGSTWSGWVHPALLPTGHMLQGVDDVFNGIVVTGDSVGNVAFIGRGAGSLPTASAILGDVIELARGCAASATAGSTAGSTAGDNPPSFVHPEGDEARLMVRIEADDLDAAAKVISGAIPGATLTRAGDMLCVLTPLAPHHALARSIKSLDGHRLRAGIPIRAL